MPLVVRAGLWNRWKPRNAAGIGKLLSGLFADAPETGRLTESLASALGNEAGLGMFLWRHT